jgi:two-component system chemotaxis response regulator CheB
MVRFRCRVGHSYAPESLSQELSHTTETALWAAMRALEEKAAMQRRVADSIGGMKSIAKRLRDQSAADDANAKVIREMIFHRDDQLEEEGPEQRAAS